MRRGPLLESRLSSDLECGLLYVFIVLMKKCLFTTIYSAEFSVQDAAKIGSVLKMYLTHCMNAATINMGNEKNMYRLHAANVRSERS